MAKIPSSTGWILTPVAAGLTLALLSLQPARAACNDTSPASGQTVTCTNTLPNPQTTAVVSANGVTGVTLNNNSGSRIDVASGPSVSLGDGSTVTNAGILADGILFRDGSSVLNNSGIIANASGAAVQFNGSGNNAFTNSGTVSGAVNFGSGNDTFTLNGGQVSGNIDQGSGADRTVIHDGVFSGTISQGAGIDDFVMTGGRIDGLAQGDNRDTFTMTGGTITGAFIDGDVASMSGGSIGRVDMKLDNNIFDMSGGRIVGNLVTGFGNDTITLTEGTIGGNISVSGGTDIITVRGGTVNGQILMSTGNDSFLWEDGGVLRGAVQMAADNDTATLRNLDVSQISTVPSLDGGVGTDTLTFENAQADDPARFSSWETVRLQNGSALTMNSPLTLGDSGTGTGTLTIDDGSTLYGGELGTSEIASYAVGRDVTVNNSGTLDLTNGGDSLNDSLTIHGNYVGNDAILKLQTELADDSSPTDRLIISGGEASGSTQIQLTNVNGQGAGTTGNGIELVSAINNATTTSSAFSLRGGSVSAGAYEYVLFRGGVTQGSEDNWYLRNELIAPPASPTEPSEPGTPGEPGQPGTPGETIPVPQPAPGSPTLPEIAPGDSPIPIYRPETPLYSAVVPVVLNMGLQTVSTFHERQGSQIALTENGDFPGTWGRVWGMHHEQSWSGDAHPVFDGSLSGVQVGQDLWSHKYDDGQRDHAGLFYSYSYADGDVNGLILGFDGSRAGKLKMNGNSVGGYWTHLLANDAYLDAVAMYTWLDGTLNSIRNVGGDSKGRMFTGSLEAGYPFALSERWSLEPQAQFIGQHVAMDDIDDGIAQIRWDDGERYTGRLGTRLMGNYDGIEPYLKVNLWHDFQNAGDVNIGSDKVGAQYESTSLEVGAGMTAKLAHNAWLNIAVSHTNDMDSQHREDYSGTLGVRVNW